MNDDRGEKPQQARRVTIESQTLTASSTILRVVGVISGEAAGAVLRSLAGELNGSRELLVLDLRGVSDIDVAGLDALHTAAGLAADEDIEFCLVDAPDGAVRAGLEARQSADMFEIFSSVSEVLGDFP